MKVIPKPTTSLTLGSLPFQGGGQVFRTVSGTLWMMTQTFPGGNTVTCVELTTGRIDHLPFSLAVTPVTGAFVEGAEVDDP